MISGRSFVGNVGTTALFIEVVTMIHSFLKTLKNMTALFDRCWTALDL